VLSRRAEVARHVEAVTDAAYRAHPGRRTEL
jgi:hypothetical protein